jgi:adenylate cyclase
VPASSHSAGEIRRPRDLRWLTAALLPLAVLCLIRLRPVLDVQWESHPAHFWLVLGAAAAATALGYTVSAAARTRRDARLFLVSLAFIASAGFLGLHALATPGVLVGPNRGFELATPCGLVLAGALVALSAVEITPATSVRLLHRAVLIEISLFVLIAAWAVVSLAQLPPLNGAIGIEELNGWQLLLGAVGVVLYAIAALGYLRLYRHRRLPFVLAVTFAFALLAEAMVVIAFAENWHISWWEWHTLMLGAFGTIALAARSQWHEERFSPLYLDETLAGVKEASVLFADLQGYTTFTERNGPAAAARMLNTYFARLVPRMEELRGDVHAITGDELMVIFNKNGDQPDHALASARAAIALRDEASSIGDAHPDWPRFRIGVNSGPVLAGVIGGETGHRKHGLVGDTVNLAARLQSAAPVGQVVVGEGTLERLPPGTLVERLPLARVKGKEEEVSAFLLHSLEGASKG